MNITFDMWHETTGVGLSCSAVKVGRSSVGWIERGKTFQTCPRFAYISREIGHVKYYQTCESCAVWHCLIRYFASFCKDIHLDTGPFHSLQAGCGASDGRKSQRWKSVAQIRWSHHKSFESPAFCISWFRCRIDWMWTSSRSWRTRTLCSPKCKMIFQTLTLVVCLSEQCQ